MLDSYFHRYREVIAPTPLVDGHTLMGELGLAPGPRVGELLARLQEAQAMGKVRTRSQALTFLREIFGSRRTA
jgi:hypothetical protein